jgi:hypothetical protein
MFISGVMCQDTWYLRELGDSTSSTLEHYLYSVLLGLKVLSATDLPVLKAKASFNAAVRPRPTE